MELQPLPPLLLPLASLHTLLSNLDRASVANKSLKLRTRAAPALTGPQAPRRSQNRPVFLRGGSAPMAAGSGAALERLAVLSRQVTSCKTGALGGLSLCGSTGALLATTRAVVPPPAFPTLYAKRMLQMRMGSPRRCTSCWRCRQLRQRRTRAGSCARSPRWVVRTSHSMALAVLCTHCLLATVCMHHPSGLDLYCGDEGTWRRGLQRSAAAEACGGRR